MLTINDDSSTRVSLLEALAKGDTERAWAIFFVKYSKMINVWCRRWGASVEDAEDVVQETLLLVFRKIAQFHYNPELSFRAWLKTITHHNWIQVLDRHRQAYSLKPSWSRELPTEARLAEAVDEFKLILDRIADQEILCLANSRVRSRVSDLVWHCYEQVGVNEENGLTVAQQLGISLNYVHVNVFRVRKLIQDEIRAIDHD